MTDWGVSRQARWSWLLAPLQTEETGGAIVIAETLWRCRMLDLVLMTGDLKGQQSLIETVLAVVLSPGLLRLSDEDSVGQSHGSWLRRQPAHRGWTSSHFLRLDRHVKHPVRVRLYRIDGSDWSRGVLVSASTESRRN